jgi:hypothetical protein
MRTAAAPTIDFEAIGADADLAAVITADLGPPTRKRWRCPFHADHHPSLALTPDRRRWRCWSCGAAGDVFDWLTEREGIDLIEAVRRLDPSAVPDRREKQPQSGAKGRSRVAQYDSTFKPANAAPARSETPPAWQDPAWQTAVEAIVADAERMLWSPAGRPALHWLRSRGLADHTLTRFRLGFVARDFTTPPIDALGQTDRGDPIGIWVRRGITMPWVAPGECYSRRQAVEGPGRWVGCNVRRLADDPFAPLARPPKCQALAGSMRGHLYPWPDVMPTQGVRPALLVEGEFDALLAEQEVGHVVFVGTVGSANQSPNRSALLALARCPSWLLAFDHDIPGVEAARAWRERAPHKAHRMLLPHGKDVGEFVKDGGVIVNWLHAESARAMVHEGFLSRLQARGICLDGRVVHPRISGETVTGRITYSGPALQSLPKADRLSRLTPVVDGRVFVRADYGQIEPRIALTLLRRRRLITWDAGDDLYHDLGADASVDRDVVKTLVNKIINGGQPEPGATGRLAEFITAVEDYRSELVADARTRRHVTTLAGRTIPLAVDETNYAGKAVNRVVQGTAADIFNQAVATIDQAIGDTGAVAFLLFDELWVDCDPADAIIIAALVRSEMMKAALKLGIHIPVRVHPDPVDPKTVNPVDVGD